MNRRSFLAQSVTAAAVVGTGALASAQPAASASAIPVPTSGAVAAPAPAGTAPKPELKRPPPLAGETVFGFVRAGHNDLPKVKTMLADEPLLVNAAWDWGAGDWETALGGASHVGQREIALHLLDAGARIDAFCAAMLGEAEWVKALLRFNPAAARARGPHGFMLLFHVGHTGNVDVAAAVGAHLADDRARHFNQALQSAVTRGHTELVAWLLGNGVDNPDAKYFNGKTPLEVALALKHDEIARLLRAAGAARPAG